MAAQRTQEKDVSESTATVVVVDPENTNNSNSVGADNSNNSNNGGAAAATGGCAACACCLTCLGFFVGIPLIIAGAVFLSPFLSWIPWALGVGIACIIAGVLMFVGAIVACVMTGCCAAKASQAQQVAPQPTMVVVQQGGQVQPVQPVPVQPVPVQPVPVQPVPAQQPAAETATQPTAPQQPPTESDDPNDLIEKEMQEMNL